MKNIIFLLMMTILAFAAAEGGYGADCCTGGTWNCHCGDIVKNSCTMTYDLTGCSEGIKIQGAMLDCNGHYITGLGNDAFLNTSYNSTDGANYTRFINQTGIGVEVFPGYTLETKNCIIKGFQYGIVADDYSGNYWIYDNQVYNNTYGIYITDHSVRNKINRNTIRNNKYGMFNAGDHSYMYDNLLKNNQYYASYEMGAINNSKWNNNFMDNNVNAYESNDSIKGRWNLSSWVVQQSSYNIYSEPIVINHYCITNRGNSTHVNCSFFGDGKSYWCLVNTVTSTVILCKNNNGQALSGLIYSTSYQNLGNNWSDFNENLGFPFYYYIPGPGNGIDYVPFGSIQYFKPNCSNIIYHAEPDQPTKEDRINFCLDQDAWESIGVGVQKWAGVFWNGSAYEWFGNCHETNGSGWNLPPRQEFDLTTCNQTIAVPACTDSDGGINYTIKGRTGINSSQFLDEDFCMLEGNILNPSRTFYASSCTGNECMLIENSCYMGYNRFQAVSCPNGCSDGACISAGKTNLPGVALFEKTTVIDSKTDLCSSEEARLCQNQIGVCLNSKESCIKSKWAGCDYRKIKWFSLIDKRKDMLDNNCNGLIDEEGDKNNRGMIR